MNSAVCMRLRVVVDADDRLPYDHRESFFFIFSSFAVRSRIASS